MDLWLDRLNQIVSALLGHPGSPLEKWILIVLGLLAMIGVLGKAGSSLGIPNTGFAYSVIIAAIGVGLSLAALTAAALYLPAWDNADLQKWLWIGIPIVVSLIVVVPLICMFQRGSFLAAVFTWALGVGALAGVILLVGAVFNAIESREGDIERGKERKQEVEELTR